ncbi:hypothetical protein HMPREF9447_03654 [Bacteroides oleiciplenus YIT 12058]|uniref:Uncharacterized protein n=1 Tax=Bacteroides oleiciplenus YIT 12058 TaxID=742727 RepID=K9DWJ8_9BACE|nr:hypothetical protein HMPREF9447_03654 [Bacteroides oleiciplenus YIT 12058]
MLLIVQKLFLPDEVKAPFRYLGSSRWNDLLYLAATRSFYLHQPHNRQSILTQAFTRTSDALP